MIDRLGDRLDIWTVVGLVFQAAFMARFLVQWIASERQGKSVVPVLFWYLSLFGSFGLLFYGIVRADPVIILGHCFGCVVYSRNLTLIFLERRQSSVDVPGAE